MQQERVLTPAWEGKESKARPGEQTWDRARAAVAKGAVLLLRKGPHRAAVIA